MGLKENWLEKLKKDGFKYFVLKAEDFLTSLTEDEIIQFNNFLNNHQNYRIKLGKTPFNNYYVVNRDDVPHLTNLDDFFKAVGYMQYKAGEHITFEDGLIIFIDKIKANIIHFKLSCSKSGYFYEDTDYIDMKNHAEKVRYSTPEEIELFRKYWAEHSKFRYNTIVNPKLYTNGMANINSTTITTTLHNIESKLKFLFYHTDEDYPEDVAKTTVCGGIMNIETQNTVIFYDYKMWNYHDIDIDYHEPASFSVYYQDSDDLEYFKRLLNA